MPINAITQVRLQFRAARLGVDNQPFMALKLQSSLDGLACRALQGEGVPFPTGYFNVLFVFPGNVCCEVGGQKRQVLRHVDVFVEIVVKKLILKALVCHLWLCDWSIYLRGFIKHWLINNLWMPYFNLHQTFLLRKPLQRCLVRRKLKAKWESTLQG